MNYYQASRANQDKAGIKFEPWDSIGGVLWGTYATENADEITKLDALAKDPRSGVSSITAEEYGKLMQKKTSSFNGSQQRPTPVQPIPFAQPQVKNAAGNPSPSPAPVPVQAEGFTVATPPPPPSGAEPAVAISVALEPKEVEPPPTAPSLKRKTKAQKQPKQQ